MNSDATATLAGLLTSAVRRHSHRPAIAFGDRTYTYAQIDAASGSIAYELRNRGVLRGECVALQLKNSVEYVIADLAILKLGAVKVPLNEYMVAEELDHCLRHSNARVLISHTSLQSPHFSTLPSLSIHVCVGPITQGTTLDPASIPWTQLISDDYEEVRAECDGSDLAIIMYTGGTTGNPKGVVHTQAGMALNLLAHVCCTDIRSNEIMLLQTPLPHSAGFYLQACLLQGGMVVLREKFDAESFVRTVVSSAATWTFAVPTMLYRLLEAIPDTPSITPTLRTIVYGAAPMDPSRLTRALTLFGPVFLQIYGQTECPNLITTLAKEEHETARLRSSCGRPVPFVEVRLMDPEGAVIKGDAIGELCVRSPYQLREYHADAPTSHKAIVDGWLHTGDLAYRDGGGYLYLVDRAKDMIISGGMNVYSVEVEAILRTSEAVQDVAVVGVQDRDWGESVVAVVVKRAEVEPNVLIDLCRLHLSAYKVPKRIAFADAIPTTRYGKADKKALRAMLSGG